MGSAPLQNGRKWLVGILALVCAHTLLSLLVPRSFALTAFGDILQNAVLFCATVRLLRQPSHPVSKSRLFWSLMGLGLAMWLTSQVMWTYIEVYLRHEAPNPFVGDVILFLHIVPMMAAVAIQPHLQKDDRTIRAGNSRFRSAAHVVAVPLSVCRDPVAVRASIGSRIRPELRSSLCERRTRARRRPVPGLETDSGSVANNLSSSFCGDAPLLRGLARRERSHRFASVLHRQLVRCAARSQYGMVCADRISRERSATAKIPRTNFRARGFGIWKARLAMAAFFVTPLMVAWAEFGGDAPQSVRTYRLFLTVAVMLVMGVLVFLKQHLLDQELLSLLRSSRHNLDEMSRMKDELENKEHSLRWHSLELQRKNMELQEISFTDVLTGVWNRRYLEEILTSEAGQVLRNYQRVQRPRHPQDGPPRPRLHHGRYGFLQAGERSPTGIRRETACCNSWRKDCPRWCASPTCWCAGAEKNF